MSNFKIIREPFLSIITPCYNAEKYISETIMSILRQNVFEWELLLIDDGSTDDTASICDEYALKDNRIRVIHQTNGGVSKARNRGLDEAKGEWIVFIDADDWFTDQAFEVYIESIKLTTADRLIFNRYNYKEKKATPIAQLSPERLIRRGNEINYFLIDMLFPYYDKKRNGVITGGIRGVNCSLYRRKHIEQYHIRFDERIKIAEDAIFNFDVMINASEVAMINKMVGYYRISDTSVMHRFTPDIDDINNQTLCGFKQRIATLIDDNTEFRIAWLGLVSECIFRSMKLKYLHSENQNLLKERQKSFMEWFNQDIIQEGLDYGLVDYLPLGKKQMMQCLSKGFEWGAFLISYVSICYLRMKKRI